MTKTHILPTLIAVAAGLAGLLAVLFGDGVTVLRTEGAL